MNETQKAEAKKRLDKALENGIISEEEHAEAVAALDAE